MPLVSGCMDGAIRRRIEDAIREGCSQGGEKDILCTTFLTQLSVLPECREVPSTPPPQPRHSAPPAPAPIQREPVQRPKAPLTDYQKHIGICIKDNGFNECVRLWKEGKSMASEYVPK